MKVFILTKKRLAVLTAVFTVLIGAGISGINRTAIQVNAGERHIPVYCVETDKKQVSLSFDAAWGNDETPKLLDILSKYNVKSTFFLVGDWVRQYPDDVKKISAAGHDIGNHSDTHPYMTKLTGDDMHSEVEICNNEVKKLTGKNPTLFRPPYGDYDNNVVDCVNSMGMYCVQWSIDSLDWQDPSPAEILEKVKSNLAPGAIILMHNGAKNTPEALPQVIEYIKSQGYEIVPISQLLPKGKYHTDHTGMMICDEAESSNSSETAVPTAADITSSIMESTDTTVSSKSSEKYTGLAKELYDQTNSHKK